MNQPIRKPHPIDVARLAYQLWESRGRPAGSPEIDWVQAEQILLKKVDLERQFPYSSISMGRFTH